MLWGQVLTSLFSAEPPAKVKEIEEALIKKVNPSFKVIFLA
jgi:hypothetical protein